MKKKTIWSPQPKQAEFMRRTEFEVLYGGAAGGGKSDALLAEALRQVNVKNYRCIIFRDTVPQLEGLISRSHEIYEPAFPNARFNASKMVWTFPSGAKIFFGYMERDQDRFKYQGRAFDVIMFDELTHFTMLQYMYLKSRCRPTGPGTMCYIRASANPDGKGMGWVKARFITPAKPMTRIYEDVFIKHPDGHTETRRRSRIFVPSSVFDNQKLMENDPDYIATLASLPEAERNALLYGSWDSFTGQVFTEFTNDPAHYKDRRWTHVIDPFPIPEYWKIYRGFDFGYAKPFSVGWYAVAPPRPPLRNGPIYRIKEWYGCVQGSPNTGIKINPYEIAKGIHDIEEQDEMLHGRKIIGIADPAIWNKETGESIASMMEKHPNYIFFQKGKHERITGKMQFHYRFEFDESGYPLFQIFKTCPEFIRTVPMLTYSETKIEDIETSEEDHIYDECRYVLMENPITLNVEPKKAVNRFDPLNLNEKTKKVTYMDL